MQGKTDSRSRGISIAVASALFLGLTPIFGKQALLAGTPALAVVAVRTAGAAVILVLGMALFRRRHFYIYPLGFIGCLIAGILNGIGSLLFYLALARLEAGLAQLLYSLYPLYVALLLYVDGLRYTRITLVRLGLSAAAVVLLSAAAPSGVDPIGVLLMIGASLLYALHIPVNQRVLYEAPAPTVTLYTLLAMTAVVVPVFFFSGAPILVPSQALAPLALLTLVTVLSRVTLFAGVKSIGGLDVSLIGVLEIFVTLLLAHLVLGETLSAGQWIGAGLLVFSLMLAHPDQPARPVGGTRGWLHWLLPPEPAHQLLEPAPDVPEATVEKPEWEEPAP